MLVSVSWFSLMLPIRTRKNCQSSLSSTYGPSPTVAQGLLKCDSSRPLSPCEIPRLRNVKVVDELVIYYTGEQTKCCLRYLNWFWQVFGPICPNEWPFRSIRSGFFAIVSQMSDFQGRATSKGEIFFSKSWVIWVLKRSVFGSRFQRKKPKLDTTSECREISKKLKKAKIPKPNRQFF